MSINVTFNAHSELNIVLLCCKRYKGTFIKHNIMLLECSIITNGEFPSDDRCIHKQKLFVFQTNHTVPFEPTAL